MEKKVFECTDTSIPYLFPLYIATAISSATEKVPNCTVPGLLVSDIQESRKDSWLSHQREHSGKEQGLLLSSMALTFFMMD